VNCSLSSNNVLNPATPYGDCSLIRMANLYANVMQIDQTARCRNASGC
jgi:cytosine deaminase